MDMYTVIISIRDLVFQVGSFTKEEAERMRRDFVRHHENRGYYCDVRIV